MIKLHKLPALIVALAIACCVAACAGHQESAVAGLQTAFIGAVNAELGYAATPSHSAAVLKQIGTYRTQAYAALQPLETAAECVPSATAPCASVATAAETEAAQVAVTKLTSYLTTQGITK